MRKLTKNLLVLQWQAHNSSSKKKKKNQLLLILPTPVDSIPPVSRLGAMALSLTLLSVPTATTWVEGHISNSPFPTNLFSFPSFLYVAIFTFLNHSLVMSFPSSKTLLLPTT